MKLSGIYKITNLTNGKCYVGSAVYLRKRLDNHRHSLRKGDHHSISLQRAWNKYGENTFVFSTMLLCDPPNLVLYEQLVIDALKPYYNICRTAGSPLGFKHSMESRSKMAAAKIGTAHHLGFKHSAATKAVMRAKKLGRKLTDEHKAKIGAKSKGNKYRLGTKQPEWAKRKMSELLTGRAHTWGPKISASRKDMKFLPEHVANMSLAAKKLWQDPEFRKKYYTSRGLTVPPSLLSAPPPDSAVASVTKSASPSA